MFSIKPSVNESGKLLKHEINTHLSELNILINSVNNSDVDINKDFFSYKIIRPDSSIIIDSQIKKTYKGVITSLQDYIDRLLAFIDIFKNGLKVEKDLKSDNEINEYIKFKEIEALKKISTDTSLKIHKKLEEIIPDEPSNRIYIENYFKLRNSIEHQKSLPKEDIILNYKKPSLMIDNIDVEMTGPIHVESGKSVSFGFKDYSKTYLRGELIAITKEELNDMAQTILMYIEPILCRGVVSIINNANPFKRNS